MTKDINFSEELETRLSYLRIAENEDSPKLKFYQRSGLLVSYVECSGILDCIDTVIVGPAPRQDKRVYSLREFISANGLPIDVIPSSIPFTKD